MNNFIYHKKYQKGKWTEGILVELILDKDLSISYNVYPFFQGRQIDPSLQLMKGNDLENFKANFNTLNQIINNKKLMKKNWDKYISTQTTAYKNLLMIDNKYLRFLMQKLGASSILYNSKEHQLILLNLLKCESHREIMSNVLENDL